MAQNTKLERFFNSKHTGEEYIEMYESNVEYFNELASSGQVEDLERLMQIKLMKYVVSLRKEGYYSRCLSTILELEKDLSLLKDNVEQYNQYIEVYLFSKGVCLRYLNRYKESNVFFNELLNKFPDNELYRQWYDSNKTNMRVRKVRPIYYTLMAIGVLLLVAQLVVNASIWIKVVGFWFLSVGAFLFFADTLIVNFINSRRRRKK
jgi:tetratricopeptide (TPR) repeat protein